MDAAGIGGAAIGAAFGELLTLVIDVVKTTYFFESELNLIKNTIISLQPKIQSIAESNMDLDSPDEETSMFVDQLKGGQKLILKCSEIQPWDLRKKYKYSRKLSEFQSSLLRFFQIDVQAQLACDIKKTLVKVDDSGDKLDLILSILKNGGGILKNGGVGGYCDVPGLPDLVVGLDKPLKELKMMMLKNGVSLVVLSAPGGCGKTTLSKMLCKDEEIKGIYGNNTFFVTVSKTASLKDIAQKIFQHKDLSPPQFQSDEDAINQLENLMRRLIKGGSILLVLDDVWSEWESLIEKFDFGIDKYKVLVTSRFVFPRIDHTYKLNILNDKDAMTLFCHSAFRKDDSSQIPDDLLNKIVKGCKGFPLALTVVGRSLYGRPVVSWKKTLKTWSEKQSIFHLNQNDLLMRLQTSVDALDEMDHECYLDLGSFPEDQKIAATTLLDMWVELYDLDEEGTDALHYLLELSFKNLVNLLPTSKGTIQVDGYCNEHYVMQHDLLRELAIYQSSREPIEQRKRLIMDISGNAHP